MCGVADAGGEHQDVSDGRVDWASDCEVVVEEGHGKLLLAVVAP